MKDQIKAFAEKYQFLTITQRISELSDSPNVRIGFIGEFSAGKSSLINSILNIHLPVSIKPTTKAICLIEPESNVERNEYFLEKNGIREPMSFRQFTEVLNGEKDDEVAVIKVKPCAVLPSGCIFVDTPGIHTVVGHEADITYGYLSMLDAAVVCVNITDGIINKKLLDFICSPQLEKLHKHMVFALTWSDTRTTEEQMQVKEAIVKLLTKEVENGKFHSENIASKVFPVSSQESGNAEKVYSILKETVLEDLPTLREQRINSEYKRIAADLLPMMEDRYKLSEYDDSQIAEEKNNLMREEEDLNRECDKHEEKKNTFTDVIRRKIKSVLDAHLSSMIGAQSSEQIASAVNEMNQQLVSMLNTETSRYLGVDGFDSSIVGNMGNEIQKRLQSIDLIKDLSVMIGTSVATAWILPGASAAANAGEAAVGAGASGLAASGGKAVLTAGAKEVARKGLAEIGSGAAKQTTGKMSKFLSGLSDVLKNVNPLEHVGNFVAVMAKNKTMESIVENKTEEILSNVMFSIETPFEEQVIRPIREKIQENRKALDALSVKDSEAYAEYKKQKAELSSDIQSLRRILA